MGRLSYTVAHRVHKANIYVSTRCWALFVSSISIQNNKGNLYSITFSGGHLLLSSANRWLFRVTLTWRQGRHF